MVQARRGLLGALSVFHSKSVLYGDFYGRKALQSPKRRSPALAAIIASPSPRQPAVASSPLAPMAVRSGRHGRRGHSRPAVCFVQLLYGKSPMNYIGAHKIDSTAHGSGPSSTATTIETTRRPDALRSCRTALRLRPWTKRQY
jgi:hypothetical protein